MLTRSDDNCVLLMVQLECVGLKDNNIPVYSDKILDLITVTHKNSVFSVFYLDLDLGLKKIMAESEYLKVSK